MKKAPDRSRVPFSCYACISEPSRKVTVIALSLPTVMNSTMPPQRLPSNSLIVPS